MDEVGATVTSASCDSLPLQPIEPVAARRRTKPVADRHGGFMLLVGA